MVAGIVADVRITVLGPGGGPSPLGPSPNPPPKAPSSASCRSASSSGSQLVAPAPPPFSGFHSSRSRVSATANGARRMRGGPGSSLTKRTRSAAGSTILVRSSASAVAAVIARALRVATSGLELSGTLRTASIAELRWAWARLSVSISASSRLSNRSPRWSSRSSLRPLPTESIWAISAGSVTMAAIARAVAANRPAVTSMPHTDEITSSVVWASSRIATSWGGSTMRSAARLSPHRWVLTTTTSAAAARARAASAKQSSPRGHFDAPGHSRGPTDTAPQAATDGSRSSSALSPTWLVSAHSTRRASSPRWSSPPASSSSSDPWSRSTATSSTR